MDLLEELSAAYVPEGEGAGREVGMTMPWQLPTVMAGKVNKMLDALVATFPERTTLQTWQTFFQTAVMGNADMEKDMIVRLHDSMMNDAEGNPRPEPLYAALRRRDMEVILSAGIWFLDEIEARDMYNDPYLEDTDRELICKYLDDITGCAQLYAVVPADMQQRVQEIAATLDLSQPITPETTQMLMQRMIGCSLDELGRDPAALERLMGWGIGMITNLQNSGGSEAFSRLLGDTDLLSMVADPEALQTELGGMMQLLASGDADQLELDQLRSSNGILGRVAKTMFGGGSVVEECD